jgi:hypothetical protein
LSIWPFHPLTAQPVDRLAPSDLMFGDAGSLYVFLDPKGGFHVGLPCY